ncbi:hypothetical protein OJAV_G00075980 [Oryzias javanicus]|uniref:Myb/SANT-like DNA-binding domain-containing protein n=1 Tax=Oryzias javanicus TaxID=123683 RepID=A0A437D3L8_ORYJA|nr:hypothetical protein OJAV_G00075980 [Oryzias javanicus]
MNCELETFPQSDACADNRTRRLYSAACFSLFSSSPSAMEGHLRGGDVAAMHVKTEDVDENSSAPVAGSRESPASCGDAACREGGVEQTAEELAEAELQAAATPTPLLLYPTNADRFFTTSADGKTYLKISPTAVMPSATSEKLLSSGSDFSSKAVLCLIEAVGRRWGLYETRERSQLFQSVQEEMASKGHILPVEKIRRKWNNLIVTYKRVKDRSRETGHAKTSWEFFDLMDATLSDTIGTQIITNKRHKGGNHISSLSSPITKLASKPVPLPQPGGIIHSNSDFGTSAAVESVALGPIASQIMSSTAASSSMCAATVSQISSQDLKPLIVLNGDMVTSSVQPAAIVPAPPFIPPPCFTEATSTAPSLGSASSVELTPSGCTSRKSSTYTSGVIPFRLNTTPLAHSQSMLGLPSLPLTSTSSVPTSSASSNPGSEGKSQKGNKDASNIALFQEVIQQQEEQAYLDRVARRRNEAREKRRERREVRMSESLSRIATALELLSSKQDTVIALLQRLADRK